MITRRSLLSGLGAAVLMPQWPLRARASTPAKPLRMPPLIDARSSGQFSLTAQAGETDFLDRAASRTWGFDQSFLGPTVRLNHGAETSAVVRNTLDEAISVHWHGLVVPGDLDGGPHQLVEPGQTWSPVLPIDQPPATVWYHSHTHGQTAR